MQHQRFPILGRQAIQFLVQQAAELLSIHFGVHFWWPHVFDLSFLSLPSLDSGFGPQGDAERHPVQPASQRAIPLERAGLACQNQERGLGRVLGAVSIVQYPPANSGDQATVSFHKHCKRRLFVAIHKPLQQFPIARLGCAPQRVNRSIVRRIGFPLDMDQGLPHVYSLSDSAHRDRYKISWKKLLRRAIAVPSAPPSRLALIPDSTQDRPLAAREMTLLPRCFAPSSSRAV